MPDVVAVIVWGYPHGGVTELQQLWGRGARGKGRWARAILFVRSLRVPPPGPQPSDALRTRTAWEYAWMARLVAYVAGGGNGWRVLELCFEVGWREEREAAWLEAHCSTPLSGGADAAETTAARALLFAVLQAHDAAQRAPAPRRAIDAAAATVSVRTRCLLAHSQLRGGPSYEWASKDAPFRGAIPRYLRILGQEAEDAAEAVETLFALAGLIGRASPARLDIPAEAAARRRERASAGGGSGGGAGGGGASGDGAGGDGTQGAATQSAAGGRSRQPPPPPTLEGLTGEATLVLGSGVQAVPEGLVRALLRHSHGRGPLGAAQHGERSRWLASATRAGAARLALPTPAPTVDTEMAALLGDPLLWSSTLPEGSDGLLLTAAVFAEVEAALCSTDCEKLRQLRDASADGYRRAEALRARYEQGEHDELAALRALPADLDHPFGPAAEAAAQEARRRARIAWLPQLVAVLRGAPAVHGEATLGLVRGGGHGMNAVATDFAAAATCDA